jgi:hypothetical protein
MELTHKQDTLVRLKGRAQVTPPMIYPLGNLTTFRTIIKLFNKINLVSMLACQAHQN